MPGILDMHFHGTNGGYFVQKFSWQAEEIVSGVSTKVTKIHEVRLTAEDIAAYIKSEFPNVKGVRLFVCYGEEAGAKRVAEILGKPVLSSSGGPISVNPAGIEKGKMWMNAGTLKLFP
jgi:hypothetical protein